MSSVNCHLVKKQVDIELWQLLLVKYCDAIVVVRIVERDLGM